MSERDIKASWAQSVRDAREGKERAGLTYEQTIRDAHRVGGMKAMEIADAIGIQDRTQITKYLRSPRPEGVPAVRLPVTLTLHGRANSRDEWAAMRDGIAARGWYEADDNRAWHLSRAGARVVKVYWSGNREHVRVQALQAVHSQPTEEPVVKKLVSYLPTSAAVRFVREHPEVADWPVEQYDDYSQTWKTLAQRKIIRPRYTASVEGRLVTMVDTEEILSQVAALIDLA